MENIEFERKKFDIIECAQELGDLLNELPRNILRYELTLALKSLIYSIPGVGEIVDLEREIPIVTKA